MKDNISNKITIKLSVTMMKKVKYLSHKFGIEYPDLLMDLIIENVNKRLSNKKNLMPNHCITKNGYINQNGDYK